MTDVLGVAGKFVQILDIHDGGRLEARRSQGPRVMDVHMAATDPEGAGFRRGGEHPILRQQQRVTVQRIHRGGGIVQQSCPL
jgi:hypothetical protein